jgi:predicted RNA binding protein YcfA (HicA-like mRNA interferase family)
LRLQKRVGEELLKITVPAHRPIKRSTLAHILKQAGLDVEPFLQLL